MASRLKNYWLWLIAGCILAVLVMRTWNPYKSIERDPLRALHARMDTLQNAAGNAEQLMYEYALMDTIIPLIPRTPGLYIAPSNAADSTAAIRRLVQSQLGGAVTPRARVAVFFIEPSFAAEKSHRSFSPPKLAYLTGVDDAGPYCAIVIRLGSQQDSLHRHFSGLRYLPKRSYSTYQEKSNVAGPCAFWAKYGAPGPELEAWLRSGGYEYGTAPANLVWNRWNDDSPVFGIAAMDISVPGRRCLAGEDSACATSLLSTQRTVRDTHAIAFTSYDSEYWWPMSFGSSDRGLIAFIEQKFGAAAFEKFWKSSQPVEPAFAAAFNVPLSQWMHDWATTYYGTVEAGPRVHLFDALLSLLTIAFCFYLIVRFSQGRTVR